MGIKRIFVRSPRLLTAAIAIFIFFAAAPESFAEGITLTNKGQVPICVSDLVVAENVNPRFPDIVVLRSQNAADNILLAAGQSVNITNLSPPATGPAIPLWREIRAISTGDPANCNGPNTVMDTPYSIRLGDISVVSLTTFNSNVPLFTSVFQPNGLNFPIPEGQTFSVVNGVSAILAGYFFSTTPFTFGENGELIGATAFTGTVTATGNLQVEAVPELTTLVLLGTGLAGLVAKRRRNRHHIS